MSQNTPGLRVPAIFRPAVLLFDGISGRDRRRARHLKDDLESLRQESAQLSQAREQEREALQQEIIQLRKSLKGSSRELQQELQERIAETERLKASLRSLHQETDQRQAEGQSRQKELQQQLQTQIDQCDRLSQQVSSLENTKLQLETDMAEMEEWVQQVGDENTTLGQENTTLRQAQSSQDAYFKSVVTQLEAFEQRLRNANSDAWQAFSEVWKSFSLNEMLFSLDVAEDAPEHLDLSALTVALVGGHDSTRRGVIDMLSPYGLKSVVEIPPASQNKISQSRVKAKIQHCNLVVIIAGYLSHKLTDIIDNLNHQDALAGELLYLNCRGSSGVAREILLHLQDGKV